MSDPVKITECDITSGGLSGTAASEELVKMVNNRHIHGLQIRMPGAWVDVDGLRDLRARLHTESQSRGNAEARCRHLEHTATLAKERAEKVEAEFDREKSAHALEKAAHDHCWMHKKKMIDERDAAQAEVARLLGR